MTLYRRDLLRWTLALTSGGAATAVAETADAVWHDSTRRRDIPVAVRVPVTPGPWPVVLHSHGLGGSRDGGDAWGEAWAEAGCLVLHLQHPGSDIDVFRAGIDALRRAASVEQLLARVADVRFAIDHLFALQQQGVTPWSLVRPDRIGLAGHSFGAQTVQALAGQTFPVPARLADERVRAFVALSPSPGRGGMSLAQSFGAITRPFLAVTGSLDGDPLGRGMEGGKRASVFDGLPGSANGRRALLWLEGADHMTFAGNRARRLSGSGLLKREPLAAEREAQHHDLVARITALWWRAHLMDDAEALAALRRGVPGPDRLQLG